MNPTEDTNLPKTSSEQVRRFDELNLLIDVSNDLNQKDIAKKYGKAKSTVSSFFKKHLKKFVKKAGYGTWELTELGVEFLNARDLPPQSEYFYDDMQVTYSVRMKDAGMFKDGQWKLNKFVTFSTMKFGEFTVRNNCNKSITIIFPKVYGKTELEPVAKIYFMANRIIDEITSKYPQIEVTNPIPRLKTGSLGSTTINKLLSATTKNVTVRTPEYSIDNTPKPALEIKADNPFTAAAKLKDTVDFLVNGGYKTEMEGLREANKLIITELTSLATAIADFSKTFREFLEAQKESLK